MFAASRLRITTGVYDFNILISRNYDTRRDTTRKKKKEREIKKKDD